MTSLPFHQVDVFTTKSYKGNPVAVVIAMDSAVSISDEMMAAFANWTNLSETTFVLPPTNAQQADYRLRIFTTTKELPFAGHPTIGSCQAFLAAGHKPRKAGTVVQECGLGLIELRVEADGAIFFTAPALRRSGKVDPATVAIACNAMSIDPSNVLNAEWIITGPHWFALQLKNAQAVLDVQCKKLEADDEDIFWGIWGEYTDGKGPDGAKVELRTFFNRAQNEDPVTGSFAAGLAISQRGLATDGRFIISQGTKLGRQGRVHVQHDGAEKIWIGGHATVCISGTVTM